MSRTPHALMLSIALVATGAGCASATRMSPGKTLVSPRTTPRITESVPTRTCRDIAMPELVTDTGTRLVLNGMAVKRVSVFRIAVFVGGLYLEQPTRDLDGLLGTPQHRRLVVRFVRRVSRSQLSAGLRYALERNVGERLADFETELATLERSLSGVHAGDELVFDQRPGQGFTMSLNGVTLATFDPAFAEICLMAFLGPQGNLGLRNGLIGGTCNE